MRDYELMYVIAPTLGDDDACAAFSEQITQMISANSGTIAPAQGLQPIGGRRKLAYPMRRESRDIHEGYYVLTRFQALPTKITEIERSLKLADPIMRYLLTLVDEPAKAVQQD